MKNIRISTLLNNNNVNVMDLWYDWFCKDSSLKKKGESLLKKLRMISSSKKFDNDYCYVFFKNNCPLAGHLYDDFRICDMETGEVIYTVCPKSGHISDKGMGNVWGRENGFEKPLFEGSWKEIKKWFLAD